VGTPGRRQPVKVLRYDIRDVFLAAGLGLRLRKWLVTLPAVVLGMVWWAVFGYLALLSQGMSLSFIWKTYGPVPWPFLRTVATTSSALLWSVGLVGGVITWILASTAVGRITYKQLKGNDFYSWGEAWSFALRKWKPAVLPWILFFVFAGVVLGILLALSQLVGLWSPMVGLLFPLVCVGAIGILYLIMVGTQSLIMGPGIVAASNSETLESLFELLSLHAGQGKRCWFYSFVSGLISVAYTAALGFFLIAASLLGAWIMDMGHAGLAGRTVRAAAGLAPRLWSAINGVPGILDTLVHQVGAAGAGAQMPYPGSMPAATAATILVGISITVMTFFLAAQFVATFATCQTTSYLTLRWLKDEQNLLEEDFED
jgi:hypothetical protein